MGTFYGDVLTNLFFVFGDVLTNSGTFWLGGVLTRGRFDLHPNISQRFIKFVSSIQHPNFIAKTSSPLAREKHAKWLRWAEKQQQENDITDCIDRVIITKSLHLHQVNGNIFITLVVYVKHMKKSKLLDCQGNEFFPKQKGTPSLVKIEHKNTATLDSARSNKNLKSQFCN